jgi:UDP-glucose 4-epimerase
MKDRKEKKMRIAVFGGAGFLGSHVADALSDVGHEVIIYDLKPSLCLRDSQVMITGDIMDVQTVSQVVAKCDVVFNFAGIADLDEAINRPLECIKTNVLGNSILLEASRQAKIKRYVFASSLYVYSKAGSFYRSTKQASELIIDNYQEEFGLPYTILRYGSLYGPRADKNNFIYKIINQALREKKITREGDGEEIREYIHVYDAAKSSVDILSNDFENQHVIIAGNQQMKVKDFLMMIKEVLNNEISIEFKTPENNLHYEITPYNFVPKLAQRIQRKTYIDLGQGILDCIQRAYNDIHKLQTHNGYVIKEKSAQ